MAWIVGLVSSIVGGIFASWLVLRKNEYDLKRVYARQMYIDFRVFSDTTFHYVYELINYIAPEILQNIRPEIDEIRKEELAYLTEKFDALQDRDLETRVASCSRESIIRLLSDSLTHPEDDFKQLFQKFPTQIAYFDSLYPINTLINAIKSFSQISVSVNEDNQAIALHTKRVIDFLLMIVRLLKNVYVEIDYYREAKAWSWGIFGSKS